MTEITIPARDGGSFKAYIAMPARLPAPTIVVIQEIFGVNKGLRDKCDELARQGYIAVCPDLFWRLEPGVQLSDKVEAEYKKAFELFNRFDVDKGIEDLRATVHTFKGHAESTGKVGAIGYCLGGKLAFLLAARSGIDCAVGYYGVGLEGLLGEAAQIKKPVLLHVAEQDKFSSPEAQKRLKDGLKNNPLVAIETYPGTDHAFARIGGDHYDAAAATLANRRTADFLRSNLLQALAA